MSETHRLVLLTGATGYVGGRLLGRLERQAVRLRCLARNPEGLRHRAAESTEIFQGDVLDADSVRQALKGVHTAYYLVHSLGAEGDFLESDRRAAQIFADAAAEAGLQRIIYLGGLGDPQHELSPHLFSRQEVGHILRSRPTEVIELQASIVIGSGSVSFELIRALVERLPVMVCPRWVATPAQPIAVDDVLDYLEAALDLAPGESRVLEIGGPEVVSYGQIMMRYARLRGLRRMMIPVPVLTPRLSSLWLGLVTPVYANVGRKLLDGMRNPTVVRDRAAEKAFPAIRCRGIDEALERALANEDRQAAETRWSDTPSARAARPPFGGTRVGNRLVDSRTVDVSVPPEEAFAPIAEIGGKRGWYYGNALWKLRGWLDLAVGGAGMRRGRRDPSQLAPRDVVDCWRVERIEPPRLLHLAAEMRLPGRAWLQFEVKPNGDGSTIRQTAVFDPIGLSGLGYWYALYPLHELVFRGMLRGIARHAAERSARGTEER
jgi:uncharacterized protein YbjT (DUF2867 family)